MQVDQAADAPNARATPRTNMYVAGVLEWQGCSSPAKIRNMSASGALVDVVLAPGAGSTVRLSRGSLGVEGTVAWAVQGQCGIRFNSLVIVSDWLAPRANREQSRVDETLTALRAGAVPLRGIKRERVAEPIPDIRNSVHLANDLNEICALIKSVGAELADDPDVVARHGAKIQSFDIATQSLRAIAALLEDQSLSPAEMASRLSNLRVSRSEALRS